MPAQRCGVEAYFLPVSGVLRRIKQAFCLKSGCHALLTLEFTHPQTCRKCCLWAVVEKITLRKATGVRVHRQFGQTGQYETVSCSQAPIRKTLKRHTFCRTVRLKSKVLRYAKGAFDPCRLALSDDDSPMPLDIGAMPQKIQTRISLQETTYVYVREFRMNL